MTNLLIIGNGFDMAHSPNTSYTSFIKHLIDGKFKNRKLYSDLFDFHPTISNQIMSFDDIVKNNNSIITRNLFETKNIFFKRLTYKFFNLNWCDIERDYFTELSSIGKNGRYKTAGKLNSDFEIVKKYLYDYLKLEQSNFKEIWVYEQYFEKLSLEGNTMILNFNYTNTVSQYVRGYNSKLVQIHGSLDNKENPIIFGYAADDDESRKLLQFDDKEFMRNIKKHNYKRTEEENRLIQFLDDNTDIEVSIIGHSCGISDKLILNQIFNHNNVSEIRIYYYKSHEHYFETQVNIDRIMDNDSNFRKLINFQDSLFIPQKEHGSELELFSNTFSDIFIKRKEYLKNKNGIVIA